MQRRLRQRISSYLSATLLLTLLSSGIVAPEITAEKADAAVVQPTSTIKDVNAECDQDDISTGSGVGIHQIGNECIIQFRSVGTYSWRVPDGLNSISRLLVVGGGGGGAARHGGGGGAGGYVYKENVAVSPNATIAIVVGNAGGRAGGQGLMGQDSLFNNTFRAKGGGGGGSGGIAGGGPATAGGSGGGATGAETPGTSNQRTAGDSTGLGNSGGRGTSNTSPAGSAFWTGGGGGGSGGAGQISNGVTNQGGNGGAGTLNDITGELVCYAAGGGGGTNHLGTPGQGGGCINPADSSVITSGAKGGNNAWGPSYERNLDAAPNTGSGGGGGGYTTNVRSELGGAGGRGIVVIRYKLPTAALDLNAANYSGTGSTWIDTSTSANNGVLQNSPTFVPSTSNDPSFFRFDGARSQYVSTSKLIASPGPQNFSGGIWFRTTSNQGAKLIGFENTQTGTNTGSYDRHLYIGTDNRLYWGVYDGVARTVKTTQKVNDGKWHYAFFTSSATPNGNVISLSLDNGPAQTLSHPGAPVAFAGYWRLAGYQLGSWTTSRTGYFTGDIARATIFTEVLSPQRAKEKFLEMYSPVKVTALTSTTAAEIKVTWSAAASATGYNVNVYNAAGSALVKTLPVVGGSTLEKNITIADGIVANTGYRISVTPTYSGGTTPTSRRTFFNESPKSELVVPNSAACSPTQTLSGPYTILRFNTSNNTTTSCQWTVPTISTPLEYLIVGGGGGGAQNHGAGGQGGYYNTGDFAAGSISGSTVTITVGAGGAGAFNAFTNSVALKEAPNPLRNGQDGSPSSVTTSSSAVIASGGAGGVAPWENQACFTNSRVSNPWYPANAGTLVIGRDGLAGGPSGGPRLSAANGVRNAGSTGLSALALSFNSLTSFSSGGSSGIWGVGENLGVDGNDHLGDGGQGGGSGCYGGGRGGSGTVILRYLTPLPKAPSPLVVLPETGSSALYARFQASDYNTISKTWKDSSGNNRHGFTSRGNPRLEVVTAGTTSANNAKNDFVAVTGSPSESIRFFQLPKNYTLFHVARYNGANKNRIFDGTGTNWLSGFWAGRVGVAFHEDWLTPFGLADNKNPDTDWIVSTDKRNSYRSQGIDRTVQNASYQVNPLTRFGINDGDYTTEVYPAEKSDFQVAEILIYNRELTDAEVADVERYLQQKYTLQNPDVVGNVAGGGWVPSQYCPSGQVAVGVQAVAGTVGFSQFRMICQSLAVGGLATSGVNALTASTSVGGAPGSTSSVFCKSPTVGAAPASETHTAVVKGMRFARGTVAGSQDFYVAGLKLICGPLGNVSGSTTESIFFSGNPEPTYDTTTSGARSYYPTPRNPANCPAGQVVVGFNAKSGSVTDAIQIICGVLPLPTLNKPTLAAVSGTLKTLTATWETISTASSYTVEVFDETGTTLLSTTGLANISKETNSVMINATNFPTIANATSYRVRVTANGDGINTLYGPASTLSDTATTASAAATPTFSTQPQINNSDSITVAVGTTITVYETATVADGGTLAYQWTKDGQNIPLATSKDLTLSSVASDSAGVYRVVVTNTLNGSTATTTSSPFTLDVLEAITPKTGVTRLMSSTTTLQVEARGSKAKTFSLLLGGESLTITSSGALSAKDTTTAVVVDAIVQVSSNGATDQTDTFTVRYVPSALDSPTSVTLTTGNALKNLVASWKKVESATAYTVLLYDSTTTLLTTTGLDAVAGTISGDSRSVVITTANYPGLLNGETYTVRVIAMDTQGAYADSVLSAPSPIALTALPASALNLAALVELTPPGEQKIAESQVQFSAVVSGSGTGTLTYQWFQNGLLLIGETASTLTIASISNFSAGIYTVEVTNTLFGESVKVTSGGQTISVVDRVKIKKPINGLVTTVNKPYRLPITTTAGTAPITFAIDPAYPLPTGMKFDTATGLIYDTPTVKGFYPLKVVARDANNSYDTTTVFTISVVETQLATTSPITRPTANKLKSIDVEWSAVAGANRYLVRLYEDSATATSGSTPLAEVNGVTGTSYTLTSSDYVQIEDSTKYKVVVVAIDAAGNFGDSEESAYTSVTTNSPPAAPVFTTSPVGAITASPGDVVSMTSLATSSAGAVTYQWRKDGVDIEGQTSRNLVIPSLAERDAGVYSVVATSTLNGLTASTTAETATTVAVTFSVETPTVGLTAALGKVYNLGIRTVGGSSTKTFALANSTTLPNGLQLNATTGRISGTPDTTTASNPVSVAVTSGNTTITVSFDLKVVIPSKSKITTVEAIATPGVLKSIQVNWSRLDAATHMVHLYDNGGSLLKAFIAYETATGTSLTITNADYSGLLDGTEYKIGIIAVGDATTANSEESDLLTLRTNAAPESPVFIEQPQSISAAIGASFTLNAQAAKNDNGVLSYQWFKGANIIPGATSESLTVTSASVSDLTSYSVRAINTLNGATARTTSNTVNVAVLTDLDAITPTTGLKIRTGVPYRLSVEATGGAGDNTWSVVDGLLPTGLTLDSRTALITGTPSDSLTTGAVYTITLQVRDRYNATSNTDPFQITLVESTSVLSAPTLTAIATRDTTRSISLEWTLVESATSYSVYLYDSAGTLLKTTGLTGLAGSSIASTTINVNNYAAIAENTKYLVSVVANYDGPLAVGASLESTRKEVTTGSNLTPPPPSPAPTAPPSSGGDTNPGATVVAPVAPTPQVGPALTIIPGAPFNLQVNAPGANNFTVNGGSLPAGLRLDPRTGLITGTPTQSGPYSFSILATPPTPGTLITYSGNIVAPPAPTIAPSQTIVPGQPVNIQVNVPGANNFTVYGGALPAGLTIDPRTGLITGSPTQSGPYDFTILATPPAQGTLVRYTGNIQAPAPTPQPVPPIELKPGTAFDFTPNVPGATNFVLRDGTLPAGLTLDPATGRISGTPRESGPYSFSILATPPANGVLLTFRGTIEAPNSTVVAPVVNPTVQTLDPITPTVPVVPQVDSNLLVVSSGAVGTTTVLPNNTNNGLIVTSSEVVLSVAGIRANGNAIPLAQGSQLTVQAGLKIEASGTGFLPNSEVFVYMFSTPQLIGKVKTDANGNYSEQLTVPTSLAGGNHILQVNGYLKSNEVKSISLAVIVTKKDEPTKKPTTKPAATKDKKIKIGAKGVVIPFKGNVVSLDAAKKRLIKQLQMPKNRSKEVYVLGYTRNTGKPNDILVALNRAINVSKEIQRLNPKTKVGYAGLGVRKSPVCAKQKNICAVVTIR